MSSAKFGPTDQLLIAGKQRLMQILHAVAKIVRRIKPII